ncbi:non-ribosomal peptide synthetase [Streptomyces sp. URMC 127]|uniref:non-ribosomal peptide synthetase n=1 Tax=Streptomyces sp. URMC 127 TaxID=3423402 RepID=UPI003F1DA321
MNNAMAANIEGYGASRQQTRILAFAQQGFHGHAQAVLRIDGPLSPEQLVSALHGVVRRHEILRTRVIAPGGTAGPLQVVAEQPPGVRLDTADLRGHDERQQEEEIRARARTERSAPPPGQETRCVLFALSPDRSALLITLDPLRADRISFANLAAGLARALAPGAGDHEDGEEPLQYAQYAQWQRDRAAAEAAAGHPGAGPEPVAGPAPAVGDEGRWEARAGRARTAALRAYADAHGVSAEAVLLACFLVLHARTTGGRAAPPAVLRPGRAHEDLADGLGPFAFFTAVPCRADPGLPVAALVTGVHDFLRSADALDGPLPDTGAPARHSAFEYHEPLPGTTAGGVTVTPEWTGIRGEPHALRLVADFPGPGPHDDLRLSWHHDQRLARSTVRHLAEQYDALLAAVLAGGTTTLGALPVSPAPEPLDPAAGHRTTLPATGPVHRLVAERAARVPDAVAVICEDRTLTYGELDREAARLARTLQRLGVGPEVPVGLRIGHRPELPVAILAVLKAGGAYVPIDPAHPGPRALDLLTRARCPLLLATRGTDVPGFTGDRCFLDDPRPEREELPAAKTSVDPSNLAYIMFTSGSSGPPKGVMVPHAALANYLLWSADTYLGRQSGGSVVHSSIGFDLTVTSLLTPLVAGRPVRLLPGADRDPLALARALAAHPGIGLVKLTPSHLRLLNDHAVRAGATAGARTLVAGGEPLTTDLTAPWHGARVINEYGPTETVVGCTAFDHPAPGSATDEDHGRAVPIGTPVAGARIHLLDEAMRPVDAGTPGEMYIGGPGVTRGYLDAPAATAARFVPDPFAPEPGQRLYRTGDLARTLPGGPLEFLGRTDQQMKVRGIRVEPEEIRALLRTHPAVRDAVVVPRTGPGGETGPAAYAVATHPGTEPTEELLAHVAAHAPDHLVPRSVTWIDRIPLTVNGKTDTRALPEPATTTTAATGTGTPPRDAVELHVLTVFEDLLGKTGLGVDDDFFDQGGHSLLAVQLIARIEAGLGRTVPLQLLFEEEGEEGAQASTTVAALARAVRAQDPTRVPDPLVCLQSRGDLPPLFLVHPAGGEALGYRALARGLGTERPVHAFHRPPAERTGEHGDAASDESVTALARTYRDALYERHPEGPYLLAGWSFGGAVAFELARLLRADGHPVDDVLLLDSTLQPPLPGTGALLADFAAELGRIGGTDLAVSKDLLATRPPEAALRHVLDRAEAAGVLPAGGDTAHLQRRFELYHAHCRALHDYRPAPAPGRLTLIQAAEEPAGERRRALRQWQSLTDEPVRHHVVDGDHFTMLSEPHLEGLLTALRKILPTG